MWTMEMRGSLFGAKNIVNSKNFSSFWEIINCLVQIAALSQNDNSAFQEISKHYNHIQSIRDRVLIKFLWGSLKAMWNGESEKKEDIDDRRR